MQKILDLIQEKLMPVASKMSGNIYLSSLGETFQILLPILLVGAFACLGAFLDFGPWQAFVTSSGLALVLMTVQSLTLSIISLYTIVVLPAQLAKKLEIGTMTTVVVALAAFLLVTPTELYTAIPSEWLGHPGLFTAIIIGMLVPRFIKLIEDKKLYIRMPDSVPVFVTDGFKAIIPAIFVVIIACVVNWLSGLTPYGNFHNLIYQIIQIPIKGLALTYPGYLLMQIFTSLFMFVGIHGTTVSNLFTPAQLAADVENLAALQAGETLPNIFTSSFNMYIQPGGIGCALAVVIGILLFAKSKRYRNVGKMAFIPAIFGISEPVLFGIPCLLNPIMFIPWMLCPIVNTTLAYITTKIGLVATLTGVNPHWTTPQILVEFISGGVSPAVLSVIIIAIDVLIYYPFIKMLDKQALDEEKNTTD